MRKKRSYRRKRNYFRGKRKSIFARRWFFDSILLLILAGTLSWLLFATPYFEIKDVKILGKGGDIKEKIKKIIDENSGNFFLLNPMNISENIKEVFPQIKKMSVKREFPNSVSVDIEERKEVGIFCFRNNDLSCFSISGDGVIFKKVKKKDNALLIFLDEEKETGLGKEIIEESLMKDIIFLQSEFEKNNFVLKEVEIFPFQIKAKTEQGFLIYFSREFNFKTQVKIFFETFEKVISKEEQGKLEYIDLRGVKESKRGEIYWK